MHTSIKQFKMILFIDLLKVIYINPTGEHLCEILCNILALTSNTYHNMAYLVNSDNICSKISENHAQNGTGANPDNSNT